MAPLGHPTLTFGDFHFARNPNTLKILSQENVVGTYNGRGAIYQILSQQDFQGRRRVLLPALHCPTIVDPVIAAHFRPDFYAIKEDLSLDINDVRAKLSDDVAAILFVNFFGFPSEMEAVQDVCAEHGVFTIEDCAHSFLTANPVDLSGTRGAATIYSFKKLVPSIAGGGLVLSRDLLTDHLKKNRPPIRDTVVNIKRLLEQAVNNMPSNSNIRCALENLEKCRVSIKQRNAVSSSNDGGERRVFQFEYPFDLKLADSCMPNYARWILYCSDLVGIVSRRRENYRKLLELLEPHPSITIPRSRLPKSTCPWAFPILVEGRSNIDIRLRQRGVPVFTFGETQHAAIVEYCARSGDRFTTASYLSKRLLCIPVHQQLAHDDMASFCETMAQVLYEAD